MRIRQLADGALVRPGLRVVLVREALERHGLGHAYDDKVHQITSLLSGTCGLVEIGPRQVSVSHLRLAPRGAAVTCGQCARWPETMQRLREQNEAYYIEREWARMAGGAR